MGSIALISPCIPVIVGAEEEEDDDEDELADEDPPPPQDIKRKITKGNRCLIVSPKNFFDSNKLIKSIQ